MQAPSKKELIRAVAEHLVRAHHIDQPSRTVLNYLETKDRGGSTTAVVTGEVDAQPRLNKHPG